MKDEQKEQLKEVAIGNFKTFAFEGFKHTAEKLKLQPQKKALLVKDIIESLLKEFRCNILITGSGDFYIQAMDGVTDLPDASVKLELTDDDLRVKDL